MRLSCAAPGASWSWLLCCPAELSPFPGSCWAALAAFLLVVEYPFHLCPARPVLSLRTQQGPCFPYKEKMPLNPEPRHKLASKALGRALGRGRAQAGGLARRAVKYCVVNLTFINSSIEKREILWMKHFSCPYRLTWLWKQYSELWEMGIIRHSCLILGAYWIQTASNLHEREWNSSATDTWACTLNIPTTLRDYHLLVIS